MGFHGGGWWAFLSHDEAQERPAVTRDLLLRVWAFARPYTTHVFLLLITILLTTAITLVSPLLMRSLIDDAIERGATQLNASLDMRYTLTELANNAWCRDANASLAAGLLASRKLETPPQSLATLRLFYLEQLAEICAGRLKLPQVPERTESLPAVVDRYPGV